MSTSATPDPAGLRFYENMDVTRRGEIVDQNVVNGVIMGGIISLITKKAVIAEDLEARITSLEVDANTSKCRIESLESWKECQSMTKIKLGVRRNVNTVKKHLVETVIWKSIWMIMNKR